MDHHKIVHNDIKPQNYLVKFWNRESGFESGIHDLNGGRIRIVLTDFGLASSEQEGGIPVKGSTKWFQSDLFFGFFCQRKDYSSVISI